MRTSVNTNIWKYVYDTFIIEDIEALSYEFLLKNALTKYCSSKFFRVVSLHNKRWLIFCSFVAMISFLISNTRLWSQRSAVSWKYPCSNMTAKDIGLSWRSWRDVTCLQEINPAAKQTRTSWCLWCLITLEYKDRLQLMVNETLAVTYDVVYIT